MSLADVSQVPSPSALRPADDDHRFLQALQSALILGFGGLLLAILLPATENTSKSLSAI